MPISSCTAAIAASISQDCNNPEVAGFTGRGVLIPAGLVHFTYNANNRRKIEDFGLSTSDKVCAVDDIFETPFEGTNVASSSENGLAGFTKTLGLHIPMRGADVSRDIVEPLLRSREGFVAVLERKDKVGDGSYVVFGAMSALKGNADGFTQDETAGGGAWNATLSCVEPWGELTLSPTPTGQESAYEAAKAVFEDLLDQAY